MTELVGLPWTFRAPRPLVYRLEGHTPVPSYSPIPDDEWDVTHRRVAFSIVAEGVEVSTVFLVVDHQWGTGQPLLFESMVFGGPLDGEQERYSTWAEAEAGHTALCERVRNADESRGRRMNDHGTLLPLVTFLWQGDQLYSCHLWTAPRVGEFVTLPRLTSEVLGPRETPTQWRVHAVEWCLRGEGGMGEMRPEIDVHLRRLHPHEEGNRHEPTGYAYRQP